MKPKMFKLITKFEAVVRAHETRGGGHPSDAGDIEVDYLETRAELYGELDSLTGEGPHTYHEVMDELQAEWIHRNNLHLERHKESEGFRSSQISALVMYLIDRGVL